jgi:hypothetical protein
MNLSYQLVGGRFQIFHGDMKPLLLMSLMIIPLHHLLLLVDHSLLAQYRPKAQIPPELQSPMVAIEGLKPNLLSEYRIH